MSSLSETAVTVPPDSLQHPLSERLASSTKPLSAPIPWGAILFLTALLTMQIPLFVAMPLTNDAEYYDLQARNVLQGGVLYRDMLEPNLPGVVWWHMLVRSVAGFRSEALRIADLGVWTITLLLIHGWLRAGGLSRKASLWTVAAVALCYLTRTEWSQTQRDGWLLPFIFGGLWLRQRQILRIQQLHATTGVIFAWAIVEGVVWAAGLWLKPHIVFAAIPAWLVGAAVVRRPRPLAMDLIGLLLGGGVIGAAGCAWLVSSGAWEPFWQTVREWNPLYLRAAREQWRSQRLIGILYRFFPWTLVVAAAIPVMLGWLWRQGRAGVSCDASTVLLRLLLAAAATGWLVQTAFLQHQFDYIYLPTIVLSIVVVAVWGLEWRADGGWSIAVAMAFVLALYLSPIRHLDRLAAWPEVFGSGSTPAVRRKLALLASPDWIDLARAEQWLREAGAKSGDALIYHNSLISIYGDLGFHPPSRYVYLESMSQLFPTRRREILQDASRAKPKYVLTDLTSELRPGIARQPGNSRDDPYPAAMSAEHRKRFPWSLPVIARLGTIVIHRGPGLAPPQENAP